MTTCLISTEKEMKPLCHPHNCHIPDNSTDCKTYKVPKTLELSETFCEKCKKGSQHITPTIVQKRVCRNNIRGISLQIMIISKDVYNIFTIK